VNNLTIINGNITARSVSAAAIGNGSAARLTGSGVVRLNLRGSVRLSLRSGPGKKAFEADTITFVNASVVAAVGGPAFDFIHSTWSGSELTLL
jgi:hypothetical protein